MGASSLPSVVFDEKREGECLGDPSLLVRLKGLLVLDEAPLPPRVALCSATVCWCLMRCRWLFSECRSNV